MRDLYSIGEMVIDFIPGSEPASYIRKAGGAPANVAIAVTKNGLRSAMCCKVGEDDFGRFLMDTLAEYDVEAVCPDLCREAITTMAFVTLAENGERRFTFARKPGVYVVDKDITQANITMNQPFVKRPHPDYYPTAVASFILGGGSFSSRLMNRVRSDEGLAYSVYSTVGNDYRDTAMTTIALQTKVETVDFAMKLIFEEVEKLPEVKNVTALAGIQVGEEHVLTDLFTSRMFAELLEISQEEANLLFAAYGVHNEQYQAIFGTAEAYQVPLVDMFLYLFDMIDRGIVNLTEEQMEMVSDLRPQLEYALSQLRGDTYNRIVVSADVPVEGKESTELVETLRSIAERYYPRESVLVVGDITSARDLRSSYTGDSTLISLLTITFVFVILLFTFKTVAGSAILVFVIQGSIWINFSFPYLQQIIPSFVTNMIVSAIQMGATVDYAIVIMNRYLVLKASMPKKDAMAHAVNQSFATVLTSGSIMTIAGLLIGFRVSDVYVGHVGLAVGRGAFTSVILVLTVLPQLLVLLDKVIEKTSFRFSLVEAKK